MAEAIALYLGLGAEWEDFRGWHILLYIEGYGSCHYSVIVLAGYGSVAVVLLIVEVVGTLVYGGWLSLHIALVSDDSCHRLDYRYLGVLVGVESPFQFLGLLLLQLAVRGVVEVLVERNEDREEQLRLIALGIVHARVGCVVLYDQKGIIVEMGYLGAAHRQLVGIAVAMPLGYYFGYASVDFIVAVEDYYI